MNITVREIVEATCGTVKGEIPDFTVTDVVTDSREACEGSLFVPIKGERVNGHDYIEKAGENGCTVSLSEEERVSDKVFIIRVASCEEALGKLAAYHIKKVNPLRIAVTGSVGKTTTRDMIYSVVKKSGKTLKTMGNYNNNIGLPLTVMKLTDEKIAVLEMGMDKRGEIDYLSKIVSPDIGVITNIGYSHIERLGSRDEILAAKAEMINNLNGDGVLLLNGDDEYLIKLRGKVPARVIYFGCDNPECDVLFRVKDENKGVFELGGYEFASGLPGKHNIYNAVAAVICGQLLKMPNAEIRNGLSECELTKLRLSFEKCGGYTVICDCYNAAPDSMKASLKVLKGAEGKRKIAVLSAINELGELRDVLLYDIGKFTAELGIDMLVTVGEQALAINKGAEEAGIKESINLPSNDEAKKYLKSNAICDDVYLVKGSRSFKLEEICDYMLEKGE